jgi:oligoribonuclease
MTEQDAPLIPRLVWVDAETTGLDSSNDMMLEFGLVITDIMGTVIPNSEKSWLTGQYPTDWEASGEFVREMHTASGLWEDLKTNETYDFKHVQIAVLNHLHDMGVNAELPSFISGSNVRFDAGFIDVFMPRLFEPVHYRTVDNSTLKTLCRYLNPPLYEKLERTVVPQKMHRVLPDLEDTLNEYRFYLDNFLWVAGEDTGEH